MRRYISFFSLPLASLILLAAGCSANSGEDCHLVEPLDSSAWECSQWIAAADAPVMEDEVTSYSRSADGASLFAATVKNEGRVVSAKWMTTGLGVYDIHVNGRTVGKEVLKPGYTHYEKTKISFTYDVTSLMDRKAGAENLFTAQSTPGWWADKIITPSGSQGMLGRKPAFRAVLELTYSDGTSRIYGTDTLAWKAGAGGPVKHAAIFDGEEYDARELPVWQLADKLGTPELFTGFNGEIVPTSGAEIYYREDLSLSPVSAYVWEDVEGKAEDAFGKVMVKREYRDGCPMTIGPGETLVVDFGQNCAAVPSFVFAAAEGTQLTCLPGELLNDGNGAHDRGMDGPEGSVHRMNLRTPDTAMLLKYTFAASEKPVCYRPRCTFYGYRYVSITADAGVEIKSIRSVPVSSITKEMETGVITTGNELVNKLISNTLWGQRSNYLSVTTDCPQRNERLGWTADTQVFAETGSFFANTDRFFHKWLRDLRDTQSEKGGYPGVAPAGQYGNEERAMMRVGWADAGIIVPWTVWKQFGDTDIIDECWNSMEIFINHVNDTKYDQYVNRPENSNYQWGDWLSYESAAGPGRDIYGDNGPLPEVLDYWNYLCASYWIIDAGMMRDMAAATGRDAARYEAMQKEAREYVKAKFLTENGEFVNTILNSMQTPILFALKNGILEGEAKDRAIASLRANFASHDNCLQTGFLGTSILLETLTDNGMTDIAWELLLQRRNPSWLYSVDNGATTIWERWNSYMLDKGMGPQGMNSFNHYAYGVVCAWIWKRVAGIAADTAQPGFKHIIMKPIPDRRLGYVEARYNSAAGVISSGWKYEGDSWIWNFTIPEGATASVTLPGSDRTEEYTAGSYTLSVKNQI